MKYKDIPGFEGLYQISKKGDKVKSYDRKISMPNGGYKIEKARSMKLTTTKKGYFKVMLTNSDGRRRGYFVHRLVMLTFVGPSDLQVNHLDENKKNNKLINLEYTTNRKNIVHSIDKSKTTSKYVGVVYSKLHGKWQSSIFIEGKLCYLGLFKKEKKAGKAYRRALNKIS